MKQQLISLREKLADLGVGANYTDAIDDAVTETERCEQVVAEKDGKIEFLTELLINVLQSKIGQPIYWAHHAWTKHETHTVTGIKYEEATGFSNEYAGKMVVKIVADGDGYYYADELGKTVFWDEEEAKRHTSKG